MRWECTRSAQGWGRQSTDMHRSGVSRVFVGVIVAGAMAGCGSSSSSPRDVIQQWFSAARAGDAGKACSLMTPQLQARVVTGGPCTKVFHELAPLIALQLTQAKVGRASIQGPTATVPVSTPQRSAVYTLQQTGGRWVISNISNALSAGQPGASAGGASTARAVVSDYVEALDRADYQRACSDLASVVISDMKTQLGSSCPGAFTQAIKLLGPSSIADLRTARIANILIQGSTATATLRTKKSSIDLKLLAENGTWKVRTPLFVGGCCG